jgi:hypothetical protein
VYPRAPLHDCIRGLSKRYVDLSPHMRATAPQRREREEVFCAKDGQESRHAGAATNLATRLEQAPTWPIWRDKQATGQLDTRRKKNGN